MIKLYDYFRSSAAFRVRIALALKKIHYDVIPIHLLNNGGEQNQARYRNINPQGLVPTLEAGEHTITQSIAIIDYLDDIHPIPALYPKHPYERALARAFALTIAADIHPINNLRVLNYLKNNLNITDEQKLSWIQHWIHEGLQALEKQIRLQGLAQDFCYGENPGIADICLVPQLYNARRFECDLSNYPQLTRIEANCQNHFAFKQAWPLETIA